MENPIDIVPSAESSAMTVALSRPYFAARRTFLVIAALGLVVCLIAISGSSYWLDEVGVAYKASLPTLRDWLHSLKTEDATLQLPFYYAFARCWAQLVGVNEFALRAGNVPWFLLGLIVLIRALEKERLLLRTASIVVLSSPFVWYYLNEARPYAMQLGASLVVFGALYRLGRGENGTQEFRWVAVFCFGAILLAGSGMLAMLWLGAYLVAGVLSAPKEHLRQLARDYWQIWTATAAILLVIGMFYVWTVTRGMRATNVGTTDARNLVYLAYEILGFSGLGPTRLAIRTGGSGAFRAWIPWLAIYAIALASVLIPGLSCIRISVARRTTLAWGCAFALVAAFILGVGVAVHFRVLGRHFAPVFPLFVFVLASGAAALLNRASWLGRVALYSFIALSLVSALSLRFNSRHAKDDYRAAALLGSDALRKGEVVWWNADPDGASIYNLTLAERDASGHGAHFIMNPSKAFELHLPKPDLVLASKPDVYDQNGVVQEYLSRLGYHPVANLPAFTAWRAATK